MSQIIVDQFSPFAEKLRTLFDKNFADPRQTHMQRFQWDYWHVPNQYTLVRTPAYQYFPKSIYMGFHKHLVHWGRQHLGCWDITPPWMSFYVEGCKQELHSDVPHGPWAFVYSLTLDAKKFKGGETLILKPEVLSYWNHFSAQKDHEADSFIKKIPVKFNRLTVFDPRFPHGVSEVKGTNDPREARLVIHGWFTQPKTYINGFLPPKKTENLLNQAFQRTNDLVYHFDQKGVSVFGTLSVYLKVNRLGKVTEARFLTNSLLSKEGRRIPAIEKAILTVYKEITFSPAKGISELTIPLIVQ